MGLGIGYLIKNILEIPSTIPDVSHDPPGKSGVSICVNEQFQVEEVPQVGVVEDEDALHQHHVRWVDCRELVGSTRVGLEVVHWHFGLFSLENIGENGLHQLVIKSIWMVKVESALHGLGLLGGVELSVERVLAQDHHLLLLGVDLETKNYSTFTLKRLTSFCPNLSTRVSQTVDLPDAVPPATPIMKGARGPAVESFLEGEELWQLWQNSCLVILALEMEDRLTNSSWNDKQ